MKALLLHRDRDFDLQQPLPESYDALRQDLELDVLFRSMAGDDAFLLEVVPRLVLSGLRNDVDTILHRQEILKDCLKNAAVVRDLYDLSIRAIEGREKHFWFGFGKQPSTILSGSIRVLSMFAGILKTLRGLAQEHAGRFDSEGFRTLFAMLEKKLSDDYLAAVEDHLSDLRFPDGALIGAELGAGNQGVNYVLRKQHGKRRNWLERALGIGAPTGYTFSLDPRDEAGAQALSELEDRGVNLVANALLQSTEHILSFFQMLRVELAFYVGCLNLHGQLARLTAPVCFPLPVPAGERVHRFDGLYDVCLALGMGRRVVGNSIDAIGKSVVIVTGANKGGKSTFLRAVGLAQLMMQSGMFVPAESFEAELCPSLFTHYKREEDVTMKHGKLDEELARMSEIVNELTPNSVVLFNESFAATNEREGSEIAGQIVRGLLEKGVKVFFVTHLFAFAHECFQSQIGNALFLRAERLADGTRTFELIEGEPLETSFGGDLYRKIFADERRELR